MRERVQARVRFISRLVILLSFVLLFRLYFLQVTQADYYAKKAENQYVHTSQELYTRGSIFFTTKDGEKVSAATIYSGYLLTFNPGLITDPNNVCTSLEKFLTIKKEKCLERASLENRTYVEIETDLSEEEKKEISELKLAGVSLYKNQWRYYPGGNLEAKLVGFVGYSGDEEDELRGRYGLEKKYDEVLFSNRKIRTVNIFAEIFSNIGNIIYQKGDKVTGDIVTTIEPAVAAMFSNILLETNEKYQSTLTGGIIMDPKTGEIYAMDAVPSFDLNDRSGVTVDQFKNHLVEDVYEFGSIVKAITMAAGLDSRAVSRSTTYYDSGSITLNSYTISNYDGRGRGTVPMQEVLNQSLNTGVAFIADQMGKEKFRSYLLKFGFGSRTGIDLPNETNNLINNLYSKRDVEYATASFGQGIALTPIAMTRALAVLGNGGYLVTPHIAKRIEYEDGRVEELEYPKGERVISEETSEEISRMLTNVVDVALAYGKHSMPQYTIGAKTGTAQMASPGGGYYDDRYLHSFFGYFPAYDPKFIIFMYTVEPKGVQYASETLTEPFFNMTNFLLNYYTVPPDR